MKLPQAEAVRIDAHKVRDYLLSQTHPVGRFKARVFARSALTKTPRTPSWLRFVASRRPATVVAVEDFEYGRKYTVPGELTGSAGRLQVLTVWIQEPGRADVRLVTVRPR